MHACLNGIVFDIFTVSKPIQRGRLLKTVLILAVNFPPSGGVGVIRTVKFIKYLPAFGWRPLVVTLPVKATKRVLDDSFTREISKEIEIHRPFFWDYRKFIGGDLAKLLSPVLSRFLFPDKFVQWNRFAFNYIRDKVLPHQEIDLAYTSVGPHSTMLLAQRLKRSFHIPFVVDFRDPFSFRQYTLLEAKTSWQKRAEQVEGNVLKDAGHVVNVSRIWQQKYERMYPFIAAKSSLIHNGYDEDDFNALDSKNDNDVMTLGYNGTFSRLVPLDPIVAAIEEVHQRHAIPIRLNIATPIPPRKLTSRYPYCFEHDLIAHKGYLPHRESLNNLARSDIALLILNNIPATEGMLPAKTFEYLRMQMPILLLHRRNGFLSDIIDQTRTGLTVDINDHQAIVKTLLQLQRQWSQRKLNVDPDWNEIRKFDRQALTQKLADVFDSVI
jgi:glycosyltransferase involved in cell wall biosynthesis